ncbi:MAG: DUF2945 domain-containing protein [Mucilaginibacter polytrichastri]|nr:DUF2945 domain-containing protein [Mucilaginibacter polytrichastri]
MAKVQKGDKVHWKFGKSEAEGTVEKKHTSDTSIKSKGKTVKRKAGKKEPAIEIKQEDGTKVLKSESEIKKGPK